MNPVLVTGVSGFLGGRLARSLLIEGIDVVGIFHSAGIPEDKRRFRIDLRDTAALRKLFREFNFDAVFHVAAAGVTAAAEKFNDLIEVNVLGTAALGRLALENNVERFIYAGSGFEYRPQTQPIDEFAPLVPPNHYGASKAAGWMLLDSLYRLEGLPLITFRPFSAYGPDENPARLVSYVIQQALRREPIRLTHGNQVRDYTFVDDVATALRLGLTDAASPGQIYNIGSGPQEARTVREIAEEILALVGAPQRLCRFDQHKRSRHDPPFLVSDPTRAHVELGWQPRVPFAEGIERTLAWHKDRALQENPA